METVALGAELTIVAESAAAVPSKSPSLGVTSTVTASPLLPLPATERSKVSLRALELENVRLVTPFTFQTKVSETASPSGSFLVAVAVAVLGSAGRNRRDDGAPRGHAADGDVVRRTVVRRDLRHCRDLRAAGGAAAERDVRTAKAAHRLVEDGREVDRRDDGRIGLSRGLVDRRRRRRRVDREDRQRDEVLRIHLQPKLPGPLVRAGEGGARGVVVRLPVPVVARRCGVRAVLEEAACSTGHDAVRVRVRPVVAAGVFTGGRAVGLDPPRVVVVLALLDAGDDDVRGLPVVKL